MLKTPLCEDKAQDELLSIHRPSKDADMQDAMETLNGKCPTCDPKLRQLSFDLPNSLHSLTQLSCSLTGQPMNDSNPPVYLPSGYLISEKAKVKLIADYNEGQTLEQLLLLKNSREIKLKCPFTDHIYTENEL